ncbi:MAG: calcium/proton exchanger [Pirellulales bacterium]|nr:calcium/proton exchanger [Pirellulales bacterium]
MKMTAVALSDPLAVAPRGKRSWNPLNALLVLVPITAFLDWRDVQPTIMFFLSTVAIVPLAGLMGEATEKIAARAGTTLGGMLNASLGNSPEIIISLFALHRGLHDVVKASLTGSILANLLFSLGIAMLAGGVRYQRQRFNQHTARMSAGLLMLAAIGLAVPSIFHFTNSQQEHEVSFEIALVLFVVYLLSLFFTLVTHRQLFQEPVSEEEGTEEPANCWGAAAMLAGATVAVAWMSEILTRSIEPAATALGLTPIFAGVVLLAVVGNAAELFNAVRFARINKMDLSFGITVGASTQVALLVAPVLLFLSYPIGQPMDLLFTPFELASVALAVIITNQLTIDGECNWLQGAMLLAVYTVLAIAFYHVAV